MSELMSTARTKESLIVDAVDILREKNNTSLLDKNSGTWPVSPQGVQTGLNTSSAAATLRDLTETNQMTTERKQGRFRREMGSHLIRRVAKARFASLLGIRNPPPRPGPVTEGTISSTRYEVNFPQDPNTHSRTMANLAPTPPQTFKSSSPQDPRPRARSVAQPKRSSRSESRTTAPGKTNWKRAMDF